MTSTTSTPASTASVLRARSPEDLIAVVPVVLGFEPTDSVVMLTFAGRHQFHARVDLPVPHSPRAAAEAADELAAVLLEPATRHSVGAVALLVYSDDERVMKAVWRALRHGCRDRGIDVVEALRVETQRYFPLLGRNARTREVGVPFDVSAHRFLAQAVLDGRVTRRSRGDLAATLEPVADAVTAVAELAAARAPWPHDTQVPVASILDEGAWVERLVESQLSEGCLPSDAEVARLVSSMGLIRVRDAAWSCLDQPRSRVAVAWWTDVLRRTPDRFVPAVASLLAWSAYLAGDGALAWCALDRCAAADPDYSLMTTLATALTRAVPPATWQAGFDWREGLG